MQQIPEEALEVFVTSHTLEYVLGVLEDICLNEGMKRGKYHSLKAEAKLWLEAADLLQALQVEIKV